MRFSNRQQAGHMLAKQLQTHKHEHCIVYAIPRGGVPVGAEVAQYLNAPLDLVIPRKIGHPYMSEYAIAAVTEEGVVVYNDRDIDTIDPDWFNQAVENERTEARRRRRIYLSRRKSMSPKNHIAIIVDDGTATGLTMRAAINELVGKDATQLIVATPVGPADVLEYLRAKVDEVVALIDDAEFKGAVGAYYEEFDQTSDQEVIDLLADAARRNEHFNKPDMK